MVNDRIIPAGSKRPLFVTRFGLSDRTAIGVQTRLLLGHFSDFLHAYWNEGLFDPHYPNSLCLENWPFARISALKRKTPMVGRLQELHISRWQGGKPSPSLLSDLRNLRGNVSTVYFAPIDAEDAYRMREMARFLDLPFIVHLWDFLDNEQDEATHWLIRSAEHVFCLNKAILDYVQKTQNNSSILSFNRLPSASRASFSLGKTTTVAIMGDIGSYVGGIRCLIDAISLLSNSGSAYRIVYIGNGRNLGRLGLSDCNLISATGFIASAARRDEVLSQCAIGFMPGPSTAPDRDPRSKYSIPSRILDFMAVGIPVVGTVHLDSATFSFCRELGVHTWLLQSDPARLAEALNAHAEQRIWIASSDASLAAFDMFHKAYDIGALKKHLEAAACNLRSNVA